MAAIIGMRNQRRGKHTMKLPVRIGMDTSKSVFQLHGVDESEPS
jgi:hypothetical protein